MKNTYTYALLQYHHSIVLGEVLNLGLLIYFPKINQINFIRPSNLVRVRNAYQDFPENTIISYYEYFQQRINELNNNSDAFYEYEINNSLQQFVEHELLPADSSILQFSAYTKAILYTSNIEALIKKLYNLYFPLDRNNENILVKRMGQEKNNKKEDWIKPDFKNKIVKVDKDFIFLPNKNELSF